MIRKIKYREFPPKEPILPLQRLGVEDNDDSGLYLLTIDEIHQELGSPKASQLFGMGWCIADDGAHWVNLNFAAAVFMATVPNDVLEKARS